MKYNPICAAAAAALCASPVFAQETKMADDLPWGIEATYDCSDGTEIHVAYFNAEAGDSYAALQIDGTIAALRIAPSASGARYEQHGIAGYVLWTKGLTEATVYYGPEENIVKECRVRAAG